MVYEEPDYDQLYKDMKSAMCDLEEKGAPGASMFFDKIKISDKMQQIIATNGSIFEKMPIGPCTNVFQSHCITIFQMHFFIAMSFTTTMIKQSLMICLSKITRTYHK